VVLGAVFLVVAFCVVGMIAISNMMEKKGILLSGNIDSGYPGMQ
jgi:hypothetical protein